MFQREKMKVLWIFVLCGMILSGQNAMADTVIPAVPANETEENSIVSEGWDSQGNCYYINGEKAKGICKIDDKLYYFGSDGRLYKKQGLQTISKKKYYFNTDYSLATGVVKVKGKYYYFQQTSGAQIESKGIKKVDGKYYCFTEKHNLKSGWHRNSEKKKYYFDKKTFSAKTGWAYVGKYKYYFNKRGQLVQDVRNMLSKKEKSSYQIKVNRTACCVTVYAKDGKTGKYNIPVVAFVCSPGEETPIGTFKIKDKLRWHELMGPCWGQWCEHLTEDVLFHSVFYNEKNNNRTLDVAAYNKLGTVASHGCIRLTAGDAKWIYDNCKVGTKVTIYNNSKDPGPFDKPKAQKLKAGHTWDPTDPTIS